MTYTISHTPDGTIRFTHRPLPQEEQTILEYAVSMYGFCVPWNTEMDAWQWVAAIRKAYEPHPEALRVIIKSMSN